MAAAAVAGMTPTAASARASAASKSSMRCSRARSVMRARIAALAYSGVMSREVIGGSVIRAD